MARRKVDSNGKILKGIQDSVEKGVFNAINKGEKRALEAAEKQKASYKPNIEVDTTDYEKEASSKLESASKKASKPKKKIKVNLGDLFEIETNDLFGEIQGLRKRINSKSSDKPGEREVLKIAKIAEARGITRLPTKLEPNKNGQYSMKGSVDTKEFIKDWAEACNIAQEYIDAVDEKIQNKLNGTTKQVRQYNKRAVEWYEAAKKSSSGKDSDKSIKNKTRSVEELRKEIEILTSTADRAREKLNFIEQFQSPNNIKNQGKILPRIQAAHAMYAKTINGENYTDPAMVHMQDLYAVRWKNAMDEYAAKYPKRKRYKQDYDIGLNDADIEQAKTRIQAQVEELNKTIADSQNKITSLQTEMTKLTQTKPVSEDDIKHLEKLKNAAEEAKQKLDELVEKNRERKESLKTEKKSLTNVQGSDAEKRLEEVNAELKLIEGQERSLKRKATMSRNAYEQELSKHPIEMPVHLEVPDNEREKIEEQVRNVGKNKGGTGETTAELNAQAQAANDAADAQERLAEGEEHVAENAKNAAKEKRNEQAAGDNGEAIRQQQEEARAYDNKTNATRRSTKAKKDDQNTSGNTDTVGKINAEAHAEDAKGNVIEDNAQKYRDEAAALKEFNNELERYNSLKATDKKDADSFQPLEEKLGQIKTLIGEKNNLFRDEEKLVNEVAQNEANALSSVENGITGINNAQKNKPQVAPTTAPSYKPSSDVPYEDFSPVINQLNKIIDLVAAKNKLFARERNVVTNGATAEANSLQALADVLTKVRDDLKDITDKKININVNGIKELTSGDIKQKLDALKQALDGMPDKTVNINLSGIQDISIEDITNKIKALREALKNFPDKKININIKSLEDLEKDDITNKVGALAEKLKDIPDRAIKIDVGSLKDLTESDFKAKLTDISDTLKDFPDKKIDIDISSLQEISNTNIGKKLGTITTLLKDFPDRKINVNLSSLKDFPYDDLDQKLKSIKMNLDGLDKTSISVNLTSLKDISDTDIETKLGKIRTELDQFSKTKVSINLGNLEKLDTEKIKNNLNELKDTVSSFPDKKVSISFGNLQTLDVTDLSTKLTNLSTALAAIPEDLNGFSVKGLSSVNKLLQFDTDPKDLAEKFTQLSAAISQFATEVSNIKITDDSFVSSIDNLISHGDKLADLATVIRAKQSEIDNAKTEISARSGIEEEIQRERQAVEDLIEQYRQLNAGAGDNDQLIALDTQITETEQHIAELQTKLNDLDNAPTPRSKDEINRPYKEALSTQKELYDLRLRSNNLNGTEEARLQSLEETWQNIYASAAKVTEELKAQNASTSTVDKFISAYENGYQEYADTIALKKSQELSESAQWIDTNVLANSKESKYIEELRDKATALKQRIEDLNKTKIDITNEKTAQTIREIDQDVKQLKDDVKNIEFKEANEKKISSIGAQIEDYLNKFSGLSKETQAQLEALRERLKNVGNATELDQIVIDFNNIQAAARKAGEETKSFWTKLGEQISHRNEQMIAMYLSWQDMARYIRETAQEVIKLDSALTELRKVSDASTERLAVSFEQSAKTAKELGNTVENVIKSTSSWARMGYDIDAAEELARVTTLYQNVGDNISQEDASESLISTLQGFQLSAKEAEGVIDVFNELGNRFAITSGGIGESLKRSAAAFRASNTDLQQATALIAGTNEIVQDVDALGSMWTTVSARIRGATTELVNLGEESDAYVESTSKLRDLVKGITGVDIMVDETEFKDIYTIVTQIADKWDSINDIDQANITCLYVQKCA